MNTSPTIEKTERTFTFPKSELHEFSKSEFNQADFLSTFGCAHMERIVMHRINEALRENRMPEFNEDEVACICHSSRCSWSGESIITRLKEVGIYQAVEAKLAYREWCKRFMINHTK